MVVFSQHACFLNRLALLPRVMRSYGIVCYKPGVRNKMERRWKAPWMGEITGEFGRHFWDSFYVHRLYQVPFFIAENVKGLITHVDFGNSRQTPSFHHPISSSPTWWFLEFNQTSRVSVSAWCHVIRTQTPLSSGIHNGLGTRVSIPAQSHARL